MDGLFRVALISRLLSLWWQIDQSIQQYSPSRRPTVKRNPAATGLLLAHRFRDQNGNDALNRVGRAKGPVAALAAGHGIEGLADHLASDRTIDQR